MQCLEVPAQCLLPFDCFEECFEVAFAETTRSLALDNLVEDGRTVFYGSGEYLEHITLVIPIDENAKVLQFLDAFVDLTDAVLQLCVVGMGDGEEIDALLLHLRDGSQNVV